MHDVTFTTTKLRCSCGYSEEPTSYEDAKALASRHAADNRPSSVRKMTNVFENLRQAPPRREKVIHTIDVTLSGVTCSCGYHEESEGPMTLAHIHARDNAPASVTDLRTNTNHISVWRNHDE